MRSAALFSTILILFFCLQAKGQQVGLSYFIDHALQNDQGIKQNINQQQLYSLQSQLINAQNRSPQVNFTSDYLLVPYFGSNGRAVSITTNPSDNAFGYDAGLTNGGMYAAQLNVSVPLFNKKIVNALQDQNSNLAAVNANSRAQLTHDLRKAVTDQYIQVYQIQQQEGYLGQIIDEVKNRKATVEALVKRGLLQQSDYLLLEIEQTTDENNLSQAKIAELNAYGMLKNLALISDTTVQKLDDPALTLAEKPAAYYYKEKFRLDSLSIGLQQNVFNTRYKPTLTLGANGGMLASDFTNIPHNVGFEATLHLNIPIYDGHQRKINDSQTKVAQQGITYARDNFTLQQKNYLQNLQKQIEMFSQSMEQIGQLISKQELLLRLDREKLSSGQLSIMEYIKSLQDYAAAKQNLNASRIQILLLINQYNYYNW